MTKKLLTKIDDELANIKAMRAECSLIDMTKTERYIKALQVAAYGLDELESLMTLETMAIQLRIWTMKEQIAEILGVKEGGKMKKKNPQISPPPPLSVLTQEK